MQISYFSSLRFPFKIPVKQVYRKEESLIIALKVCKNFNHPVDHSRAQSWSYFVSNQTILSQMLEFEFSHVFCYRVAVLNVYVNVLTFNLCC